VKSLPTVLALVVSWGATLFALWVFPDRIPAHWNALGEVDRWGSKYELLLVPVVQLLVVGLLQVWPALDPTRRGSWRSWSTLVAVVGWGFSLLQLGLLYLVHAALGGAPGRLALRGLWIAMGLFFLLLGYYLPKVPQNWVLGVRTPWTLASPRAWQITHRVAGRILMGFGLALVVLGLFLPDPRAVLGVVALLIFAGLYLAWLSYAVWREEAKGPPPASP